MIACATHVPAVSTVVWGCGAVILQYFVSPQHTHLVFIKPVGHHAVDCLGHDVGQGVRHKAASKCCQHSQANAADDVFEAWDGQSRVQQ